MIGFADKYVQECNLEVDGQFVNHKRWMPVFVVWIKEDVCLNITEPAIAVNWEASAYELLKHTPGCVFLSVSCASGYEDGDQYFRDVLAGPCTASEQRVEKLDIFQFLYLVMHAGFPAPDRSSNILCLAM